MVHKKLMQARLQLQARELRKTGRNEFSGYDYFELGDFLPTVQVIFAELGLCGVVSFTADTATLIITDTDDGTSLQITSPMGSAKLKACHEVQNIGAVETFQRRYLWVTAMEIVEHDALDGRPADDDGSDGAQLQPPKPRQQQPAAPVPAELLRAARQAAAAGVQAYERFWKAATNADRRTLLGEHEKLKRAAANARATA